MEKVKREGASIFCSERRVGRKRNESLEVGGLEYISDLYDNP